PAWRPRPASQCTSPSEGVPSIERPVHETTPSVFLIARPSIDVEGMRAYLRDVGGESWLERRLSEEGERRLNGGELLVEFAGRACYRSWEPGLNPNVSKVRTDQRDYFANILRSAHGSVLEHANYSFALRNVIEMRTAEGAEEELRLIFDQVARVAQAEVPDLFQDFERDDDGSWVPEHRKV